MPPPPSWPHAGDPNERSDGWEIGEYQESRSRIGATDDGRTLRNGITDERGRDTDRMMTALPIVAMT